MPVIQDPVCHLTRKEKAGIWDRPRPKSKVRRPITSRHHLATDPKRTSNHPAGKLTSPKSQQFTSGTTRKCDDSPDSTSIYKHTVSVVSTTTYGSTSVLIHVGICFLHGQSKTEGVCCHSLALSWRHFIFIFSLFMVHVRM